MRHRQSGRQFGRNTSHRRAMLRALTANLVAHERIETTDAKAKELRRVAEKLITKAIRLGPIAYTPQKDLDAAGKARRIAAEQRIGRFLRRFAMVNRGGEERRVDLIEKVFLDLAKRFRDRPGGYTRIIKLGRRRGDNAPMALVEFVELASDGGSGGAKGKDKPKKGAAAAAEKTESAAEATAEKADKPKRTKKPKAETEE
ncbi:MAG TPA: 50S ribosomal protein L17 [Polyangiaceae bacterium]